MKNKETSLSYDVVVIGGGMAGLTAALTAATNNAKTLLVERHPYAGGGFTAGMVLHIAGLVDHRRILKGNDKEILNPSFWIVQGMAREYYRRLHQVNAAHGPHWDHEPAKIIFDALLKDYGVDVLYGTQFHAAEISENKIKSVTLIFRTHTIKAEAKIFIDASGDGDLGEAAGVDFYWGRESDNKMSPATLSYLVADHNLDTEKRLKEINVMLRKAWKNNEIPKNMRPALICNRFSEGKERNELWCSVVRQWGNITNPFEYTGMEQNGRLDGWKIFRYLKEHTDAFTNSYISSICQQIWPREGRHLKAKYMITADDVRNLAHFPDVIARGAFYLDLHSVEPGNIGFDLDEHRQKMDSYFEIPFRSLVAVGIDNLLLAGRTIGANHYGHSAIRVMGTGIATGEAAGTAAALLAEQNNTTDNINISLLQNKLRNQGVII